MRKRLDMYPGGKPDAAVNALFERLCNAVLTAPSWPDAMAGLHGVLNPLLLRTYTDYIASTHKVHDRPTHEMLSTVMVIKHYLAHFYEDFLRLLPYTFHDGHRRLTDAALAPLKGHLLGVVEVGSDAVARACGAATDFRLPITPG